MAKKILFVCVENSCRSQMAEAIAKRLAAGKPVEIWSAGSRPSGKVDPGIESVLAEKDYSAAGQYSKGLEVLPPGSWDVVVTLGCGDACPQILVSKRLDWNLPDPKGKPREVYQTIRDEIEARVKSLLQSLS